MDVFIAGFERQSRPERNAEASHQRGAVDIGKTIRIGSGKAARDFAIPENEAQARRGLGMLMHDHFTAPLAPVLGIRAGVIEETVASHDAAILEDDHPAGVAALDAGHLDPERVQSVRNPLPGFGAGRAAGFSRDVQGWGLQTAVPGRASVTAYEGWRTRHDSNV